MDFGAQVAFDTPADSYGPWRQTDTGDEVLQSVNPTQRYGIGVLYPAADRPPVETEPLETPPDSTEAEPDAPNLVRSEVRRSFDSKLEDVAAAAVREDADDDFDLTGANDYRPSTMAISFLVDLSARPALKVEASGGRYAPAHVSIGDQGRTDRWWLRSRVTLDAEFPADALAVQSTSNVDPGQITKGNLGVLELDLFCISRPFDDSSVLVTIGLANRTRNHSADESSLFQTEFHVRAVGKDGTGAVRPYPAAATVEHDDEEQSIDLLYRNYQTFAIGHGCAANWDDPDKFGAVHAVRAECLPSYQTPSITPDVKRPDQTDLIVPMAPLAGLVYDNNGFGALHEVVDGYKAWIESQAGRISFLPEDYITAAKRHIEECRAMLARMRSGLEYLEQDDQAAHAFELANRAVLMQQIRAGSPLRRLTFDRETRRLEFSSDRRKFDPMSPPKGRGTWRPFQIAFLLATVESTANAHHEDRELVDLIFFPTGGGKTEAYLGLSAFSIFVRRLRDPEDNGTQILMRYTLRLLTAQQLQRAAALMCAMEAIRREEPDSLGTEPFRIGIWVGGGTTPNKCEDARGDLKALREGDKYAENKFVIIRCPWCAAEIGPITYKGRPPKGAPLIAGYEWGAKSCVTIHCTDPACEFASTLPVLVVDQQIYKLRPDIVVGTVDKFAVLAWEPAARSLFGIGDDGRPICSPPGLIIQDELHLISGPLGSMVGIYEAVIDDFCTSRQSESKIRPKIVSSTATIRRYEDQVRSLFARPRTALFPPRGLEISDSYFASYATHDDGTWQPGRLHIGVHGAGLGSMQTAQVRTFSALLQAPKSLADSRERDPWWTLLAFFNSLRELGTSLSLLQSDIPDYLKAMKKRTGIDWSQVRRLNETLELTGRITGDEVPKAIRALEISTTDDGYPVDVCLASNIIEVGVDIDRLSLLTVVGQPKTTAQYIQVSGRVGRRWWERPGVVVTIYGASKPRDRSHFEKFRSYHERLYAQVEPTSVTPFSPPVLDRAAHGVLISYVRQRGDTGDIASPYPIPEELLSQGRNLLEERLNIVDEDEREDFERVVSRRLRQWRNWERTSWVQRKGEESFLMRQYGSYVAPWFRNTTWQVATSLRNVDAECEAVITSLYAVEAAMGDDDAES